MNIRFIVMAVVAFVVGCDAGSVTIDDNMDNNETDVVVDTDADGSDDTGQEDTDIVDPPLFCEGDLEVTGNYNIDENSDLSDLVNVTKITGNLVITNINNIEALACLEVVDGSITIKQTQLVDLTGLENLVEVTHSLNIEDNDILVTTEALGEALASVAADPGAVVAGDAHLHIFRNPMLVKLGLRQLSEMLGYMWILDNTELCQSEVIELSERLEKNCAQCEGQKTCE